MTVIEVDGSTRTERGGRRLELDEVLALVGGDFKIDSTVTVNGVVHQCLVSTEAFNRDSQNATASRICGRVVWGRAVFLIYGEEI